MDGTVVARLTSSGYLLHLPVSIDVPAHLTWIERVSNQRPMKIFYVSASCKRLFYSTVSPLNLLKSIKLAAVSSKKPHGPVTVGIYIVKIIRDTCVSPMRSSRSSQNIVATVAWFFSSNFLKASSLKAWCDFITCIAAMLITTTTTVTHTLSKMTQKMHQAIALNLIYLSGKLGSLPTFSPCIVSKMATIQEGTEFLQEYHTCSYSVSTSDEPPCRLNYSIKNLWFADNMKAIVIIIKFIFKST